MTRREDMAERILHAALAHVQEHGVESTDPAQLPHRRALLGALTIWKTHEIEGVHRLDIWQGREMLFLATWRTDEEPELQGITAGLWMETLLGPLDVGRECFAFERLANAFVEHWQRPAMSEAEALRWGATLPDDRLRSFGFSDRAAFDKYSEALIAFEQAEQSSTVLH